MTAASNPDSQFAAALHDSSQPQVPITKISFPKPFGNIKVEFPFGEREPYEVAYGHVALTAGQAEEARAFDWSIVEKVGELVEVSRSFSQYALLVQKQQC